MKLEEGSPEQSKDNPYCIRRKKKKKKELHQVRVAVRKHFCSFGKTDTTNLAWPR